MAIKFDIIGSCGSTGESYIRVRWTCNGIDAWVSAKKKIYPAFWRRGEVVASDRKIAVNEEGCTAGEVISYLNIIKQQCLHYESVTPGGDDEDALKIALREFIAQAADEAARVPLTTGKHKLQSVFRAFIEQEGVRRCWTKSTYIQYKKLIRHFDAYKPRARVEDISLTWTEGFFGYLVGRLCERTTHDMMISFFSFVKWAAERYDVDKRALRFTYKARNNIKDLVFLDADEIRALAELKFPDDGEKWIKERNGKTVTVQRSRAVLEESRDMFLFCCMTGLRFSDMQRLEWMHVFQDSIKMYTKKTMKPVEIALNPVSQAILDRRWESRGTAGEETSTFVNERVFPARRNAELNDDLKVIGRLLNLDDKISRLTFKGGERVESFINKSAALTTHCARHSFTVQALSAGVPGSVVMSWTGHSNYNSLKPYLGLTSSAKKEGMKRFEKYLEDIFEPERR